MQGFINKLLYYRDFGLLVFVIKNIIVVALTDPAKKLGLIPDKGPVDADCPEEKVVKYVTFVFFVMWRLWIRLSCFNRSIAACRILRMKGVDSKVVFGCAFDNERLTGHCWVESQEDAGGGKFRPVFSYPLPN